MKFEELESTVNGVLSSCTRFPELLAVDDGTTSWTYAQLRDRILESVRAFIGWGVRPGDRVGLCAANSAQWIVAALGMQGAGGVLIPLNTRFKGDELAYILDQGAVGRVLTEDLATRRDMVESAGRAVPAGVDWAEMDAGNSWAAFLDRGRDVSVGQALDRIAAITADDPSDILFTSGTTGYPKGVVFTHGQSLRAYGELGIGFGFRAGDRYLLIPPFFHALGYKSGWFAGFLHGVAALPERRYDAPHMIERIERQQVTLMIGPPTIFAELLARAASGECDLSSLRLVVPAATNVAPDLVQRMRTELGLHVLSGYGLTESSAIATYSRVGDPPELVAGSAGRAAPGVEIAIVDDDDHPVQTGKPGNILVGGYCVMKGYWRDPEATAAAITPDGWLRTGDIGTLDEHGVLRITGRKKDVVIVGGFNVYPAEVERLLGAHPQVAEVAVVGVPDARLGEVTYAFVVPVAGATVDRAEFLEWARARMSNFKAPRYVESVRQLPKNSMMKVLRDDLRQQGRIRVGAGRPD